MYIKTDCPHCGQPSVSHVVIHYQRITEYPDGGEAKTRTVVKNVEVLKKIKIEDFAKDILNASKHDIKNGMSVNELHEILRKTFGVAENSICDITEILKTELDLYCDQEHLYFIKT